MKKSMKRHGSPEKITTGGLRSYRAAMNELGNANKQEIGRWANNRVENSHLSFRRRERAMLRFRRMKTLQSSPRSMPASTTSWLRRPSGQPGTPPRRSPDLKGTPLGRTGRVAEPHSLRPRAQSYCSAIRRRVAIRLTAPPRSPSTRLRLQGAARMPRRWRGYKVQSVSSQTICALFSLRWAEPGAGVSARIAIGSLSLF